MYKLLPILLFGILIAEEDYFPKHKLDSLRNILRIENENNSSQSFIDSIRYTGMFKPDEIAFDSLYILYPEIVARGWMNYEEHYQSKKILLVEEIESRLNSMSDNKLILFNVTFEIIDSIDCNTKEVCVNDHYSLIVEDEYGDSLYWGKLIKEDVEDDNNAQGLHIFTIREQTPLRMRGIYYYNPKDYEYKIITGKINIEGIHDYRMDKSLKAGFVKIINSTHPSLLHCEDCISFTSVDMDSLRSVNKKGKSTISLTRDDIYDDSWAVIIGIDKYENLSNLDYAVADAEAVKDMLVSKFDYKEENVKLLLNEEANKTNIVNVISDVSLKAGENDRILVFYAGHGETMPLPEGGEMGYLVPIDGNQDNLLASAIPMDDLKRFSNVSKAKHMLFLIDACYGGLAAVGSRGLEPAKTPNYIEKISNIKSRQIITAGGKDEKVFEKSEWGHSAYTKNLLSALEDGLADSNGDGYITADELGDYLSEKVSIDSENQQTPQSRRLTSHEGEFIFIASDNDYSPSKYDINNNTVHSKGVTLPSDWGTISVKDRLKKRLDEASWSEEPTGFGEGYFGCTDSSANNFNPDAYEDDGSCKYIDKINEKDTIGCLDNNEIIAPLDCKEAANKYGCYFPIHGLPNEKLNQMEGLLEDICRLTCDVCPGIKLSIGDYQEESIAYRTESKELFIIDIMIDSDTPIAGFQFDVVGATINSISDGEAGSAGFMMSNSENTALGFSLTGATIPIGKGVLVVLDISNPIGNTVEICLENITLSSSQGEALDFEVGSCKYFGESNIYGCTDMDACNYNPNAKVDNGNCDYGYKCWDGSSECNKADCPDEPLKKD